MRRVAVVLNQRLFCKNLTQSRALPLMRALDESGFATEIVKIPFSCKTIDKIYDAILTSSLLDVSGSRISGPEIFIGVDYPSYHIPHGNKKLWLSDSPLIENSDIGIYLKNQNSAVYKSCKHIERALLQRAPKIFGISKKISESLQKVLNRKVEILYPPPTLANKLFPSPSENYLYYNGDMQHGEYHGLIIESLSLTKKPVDIYFSSKTHDPEYVRGLVLSARLLGVRHRIKFLHNVSDELEAHLYNCSNGIIALSKHSDPVTSAMLAGKPVLASKDAFGSNELIRDNIEGFVCPAEKSSLGFYMDALWSSGSPQLGNNALKRFREFHISWETVVQKLTS